MVKEFFNKAAKLQVLVLGDVMVDRYINGKVGRISPEAPVPVVEQFAEEDRLGGAANVALNLQALGATPLLCGVVGSDQDASAFFHLLNNHQLPDLGIVTATDRVTTVKTRIIAEHQHLLRLDKENVHDLSPEDTEKLIEKLAFIFAAKSVHVIILQDYNKGVLTPVVIKWMLAEAKKRSIPVVVDPKFRNIWLYEGVGIFKPNLKEIRDALHLPVPTEQEALTEAAALLHRKLGYQNLLLTLSEKGVFMDNRERQLMLPTRPRNVADVCGAGDAVVSVAAVGLALGLDMEKIALLANLAGGQVVERMGVVPIDAQQLREEMLREVTVGNW